MEIIVSNMTTGYYGRPVLRGVTFDIKTPGIYVVIGKNGAGKTTLFRAIAGILRPYEGSVLIGGSSPYNEGSVKKNIAFLSHAAGTPEGFTVKQILKLFAEIENVGFDRIDEVSSLAGIEEILDNHFGNLSQGQKKRVSIAKCILAEKNIYLLDEPTTDIDPKAASLIRSQLLNIARDSVVFYSSHNLIEAREIGDKVIAIDKGEVVHYGDIESLNGNKYIIGIRGEGIEKVYPESEKKGEFYILELNNSDEVQGVIERLMNSGAKIREIRQMNNPLEEFFE